MIFLKKLANRVLDKKRERLYGKSEWKPMLPLFKNEDFNLYMTKCNVSENVNFKGVNLGIEKYNISSQRKQEYLKFYNTTGLYAYFKKYNKWLKFKDGDVVAVSSPPKNRQLILPNGWQKYVTLDV